MDIITSLVDPSTRTVLIGLCYVVSAVLFILGLKGLTHPRTAVRGNLLGATGMLLAVVVTLLDQQVLRFELIFAGLLVGGAIGAFLARTVAMTAMPQLVGAFNGFGGGASVLVATAALFSALGANSAAATAGLDTQTLVATVASCLIGAVTFTGSFVAFCKLQGILVPSGAVTSPVLKLANVGLALASLGAATMVVVLAGPEAAPWYWGLVGAASLLGLTLVIPIGGADMPVVIALLNSYSGMAACATGFVLSNSVLIISGALVGASGMILTRIMCKAMNRSLANVLFGGFGAESESGGATDKAAQEEVYAGKVTSASVDEAAMIFDSARRVIIVPGYGMAVSQAQHSVRDLANLLESRGAEVLFAIHPVAGRMPGHMNVLLAEADVPYDKLQEMDAINPTFAETDVALVIGANDVVNPLARTDPKSPIAGMPVLNVDKARTVMVVKRSLSPGFAGIANPLFAADNTMMLFGDGKKIVVDLAAALKEAA